ncbi:hypothetical protein SPRG_14383 [Saprolegnia parasitica CBS 223.65]|uniref:Uncharacterized protein n=1 Tax=Saprolegnia parasitica (strain CBS 223.65) TaxID=695850 RepID=A0A067BQ96_SAPPC|nr:hypothetical protein SPRG_14383 [Saprolegnia parasitica CBS 223.65]KDO18950.1 hypothetical protein SPRG_14383 [Saprolegnia parasitica CBS 223.65]|eukprot:XP_012210331.1 hypothetical protein SPRG_14383 [Saprolegnia parasitica CBS 223.65]
MSLSERLLDGRSLPPNLRVFVWGMHRPTPAPRLTALHHTSQLRTLDLSGNHSLFSNAIAELLPHLPHLQTLNVSKGKFAPGDVVQLLTAMSQRPSLQHVLMRQCNLPRTALPLLVACIAAWPSLRRLDLAGLYLPPQAFKAMVTALGRCPNFASLSLRFPPYTDAMWRAIAPALGAGLLKWRRVFFSECEPTAVQVVQCLRRLLKHNQEAFTVTCCKGYSAAALQNTYTALLDELAILPPTREAAACVVAFVKLE